MARKTKLTRKSFFVEAETLRRAKKALGVATEAEAVRLAVETIAEMEEFWQFMKNSRHTLPRGSLRLP